MLGLGLFLVSTHLKAQESKSTQSVPLQYQGMRWFPNFWGPYENPYVPAPRMSNSDRLHALIRDGSLHLTVEDAIALALENNLDIAVSRYTLGFAQTDILRAAGGGAARGFAGSFSSAALFAGAIGGGVSAGGVSGGGGAGGVSGSATATQLGGGTFDPSIFFSMGWDRNTTPLGYTVVTGVPYVTSQGTSYATGYQQEFQTGTSFAIYAGGARGTTTSLTPVFNPEVNTFMAVGFTQPLLSGYGRRANAIQIRLAKNNMKVADSQFRQQVITTVSTILNEYWDLVSYKENVRVAQEAVAWAEKQLADNKRQVEIGTLAPIEVVRAESELAADQQALIVNQTTFQQQAELVKTALSKQVDPQLAKAQIVPEDKLPEPAPDDAPPLEEALRLAMANRPEIEQLDTNMKTQYANLQARRNALLPSFNVFATYIATGLAGNQLLCPSGDYAYGARCAVPNDGFVPTLGISSGGVSQALTQTWQGHYPNYSFGVNLSIPIRNRSAQADAARALLEERQLETQEQQTKNNIAQQVRSAEIGVVQAKAQIEAARKATELARQTLDAEQKKFQLGESTVFLVIQAQRDLATQEGNEVKARSTYAKALTTLQQQTATILQKHNIEISDAVSGHVERSPNIPGAPSQPAGEKASLGRE
jgi:outer membrane protein TolC